MSKHTPGPWHWDSDKLENQAGTKVRYRVCAKGRTITQLYYPPGDKVVEADTRLISAAPDLLAALEKWLLAEEHENVQQLIKESRAAIAKAKP